MRFREWAGCVGTANFRFNTWAREAFTLYPALHSRAGFWVYELNFNNFHDEHLLSYFPSPNFLMR